MSTKDNIPSRETASENVPSSQGGEQEAFTSDEDVRILSTGHVDGHQSFNIDLTGDGKADVTVIDVDDSGSLTDPDVVIESTGNVTTWGAFNAATQFVDDDDACADDLSLADADDASAAESCPPFAEESDSDSARPRTDDDAEDASDVTTFTEDDDAPSV